MKKYYNRYLVLVVALFLILIGVAGRIFFPPFANLLKELPEGNFNATDLFQEFTADPPGAYIRLANRAIIMEGEVAAVGDGFIMLGKDMYRVKCMFRESIYDRKPGLKTGDKVTVKGVCQGLNMTEVLVTHCIIIHKMIN